MNIRLPISCIIVLCFIGCSTEKNSFKNRSYHKLTAWYNILHNGQEAMDQELDGIKNSYEEDYSEILPIEPLPEFETKEFEIEDIEEDFVPGKQQNERSGDFLRGMAGGNLLNNENSDKQGFEKAEEKAVKAIKKHSMEINGVERNKIISRAYLMLGQSRYYQGKTFKALEALNYATDHLPSTKHDEEIKLYLALAQFQAGNQSSGEELLAEIEESSKKKKAKKKNKALIAKIQAQHFINEKNYAKALEALEVAESNTKNKKQRARYHYIMGQIFTKLNQTPKAAEKFTKAVELRPGFDFEVKSEIAIAENYNPKRNDYKPFIEHFKKVSKKGNYHSRKYELQYALGLIELRKGNLKKAKEYLDLSLSETNVLDQYVRAKTYLAYADLMYAQKDYVYTSAYYDSAYNSMPYEKQKEILKIKNENLKNIIDLHYLVQKNDSILNLAYLPKEEQENYFEKYIKKLKIEDEKKREEEEEELYQFQDESKITGFSQTFSDDSEKGKFYFYSTNAKNFGYNEFTRIWGNINLTDNWRLGNKQGSVQELEAELLDQDTEGNPRRYDVAYYMESVPTDEMELDNLKVERDSAELKLGIGYYEELNDSELGIQTLEHLISTPPKKQEVDIIAKYNLYKIAESANHPKTEEFKNLVLSKYPNSIYAKNILNPGESLKQNSSEQALTFYKETYNMYLNKEYAAINERVSEAEKNFPNDPIIRKFHLLNAYAEGKVNGKINFEKSLKSLTLLYPNSEEAKKANQLLQQLKTKTELNSTIINNLNN